MSKTRLRSDKRTFDEQLKAHLGSEHLKLDKKHSVKKQRKFKTVTFSASKIRPLLFWIRIQRFNREFKQTLRQSVLAIGIFIQNNGNE